ncbi:MAG TPA: hypothetical protein VK472_02560 [Allosphingosinicella sp.]|nr:hypothetical protein [Allosphingosinicella sp.]
MKIRFLLLASACAALPTLLAPDAASAQAFAGGATVVAGTAVRDVTTGTTETITVSSPSAIINWKPEDVLGLGPVNFLPAGNVATFQNGPNNPDFAVLNRILPQNPARAIALNGNVISQLQMLGQPVVRGGTVAFYSPGGIIIGSTAVFDIGNLLLTTIDPIADLATGNFFAGNTYNLSGPVDPKSFVRIDAGARINATAERSYVAVASPLIEQSGAIRVNGSTALVAAESLTMTIDQGLFDIQVKVGSSSAATTIVHQGSTGGPGSGAADDNHKIYMVAIPKNTAISLLLRGSVGYDAASVAGVENGEIILSAGYNVNRFAEGATLASPVDARIDIRQANASSDLTGIATTSAVGTAFAGQTLTFQQDVTLISRDANLGSEAGLLTVGGNATVETGRGLGAANGGQASIFARGGGTVNIAGDARVDASVTAPAGSNGTGGSAVVSADTGTINIAGNLTVDASAIPSENIAADPGDSQGGNANVAALNGGKVNVTGSLTASANADGGLNSGVGDGIPGSATGGNVSLGSGGAGSGVRIGGALNLSALGQGGSAVMTGVGTGSGRGGNVRVASTAGGLIDVAGASTLDASGTGGTGLPFGAALAPTVGGGQGLGGSARIIVAAGTVQLDSVRVTALGTGGAGTGAGRAGGAGQGGLAEMRTDGGTLNARDSLLTARGVGGIGATAGTGTGGTVNAVASAAATNITGDVMRSDSGGDSNFGNVRMNQRFDASADGTIHSAGIVAAPLMNLSSRDIDIQAGAQLGADGTANLNLTVLNPVAQTVIGGAVAGAGYTLDAAEIARLRSDSVSIVAPPLGTAAGRPPDVLVDDFTLLGTIAANPFTFSLETRGTMRVIGDVRLTGADATDRMGFRADERFELFTPGGSIYLLDGAGNPGGRLGIESSNIVVADAALAAQLAADPNFAGRNAALLANPGPVLDAGYLQAGGITFRVGTLAPGATLFIQNTGTANNLRGLTVGPAGLTIAPQQNRVATVVAFGRRRNDDGSFTTGDAFFATVNYDRANGTFTDESEVNLCKINSGICPAPPAPPGPDPRTLVPPSLPGAAIVLGPLLVGRNEATSNAPLIDTGSLNAAPLIEEPVASGGDSSLWIGDEEEEDRDDDSPPD